MRPRHVPSALAASALTVALAGCGSTTYDVPRAAATVAAAPTTVAASVSADRRVCVDFDARGGALYSVFVVPMMAGASGQKSIDVDVAQLSRATATLTGVGAGSLDDASVTVRDEGERMVAAAQALGMYDHAEGTALLTSFVGLAVACQTAGHKPSWFDAEALAR